MNYFVLMAIIQFLFCAVMLAGLCTSRVQGVKLDTDKRTCLLILAGLVTAPLGGVLIPVGALVAFIVAAVYTVQSWVHG